MRSTDASSRGRWILTPRALQLRPRGSVTWIGPTPRLLSSPVNLAAGTWLSVDPSPAASTAAIQRASRDSRAWPTA